jgi:hypothetical protein
MRGLSTRRTGFSISSPAFTARRSTLESGKISRSTVDALRPARKRLDFHDSMRSTIIELSGSGYQVRKWRLSFSRVLAAVRGRRQRMLQGSCLQIPGHGGDGRDARNFLIFSYIALVRPLASSRLRCQVLKGDFGQIVSRKSAHQLAEREA